METIILLLFIVSLTSQQALCQEVKTRDAGNKVNNEADGQQRSIYSQKHLSPHRMMHFGKRPANLLPPTIITPAQVFDPYLQDEQQQSLLQRQQRSVAYLQPENPFLFSIELEQGRTIQALPEGLAPFETLQPNRETVYNLERRPQQPAELQYGFNLAEQSALRQATNQVLGRHKLMKLMQNNEADESIGFNNNLVNGERPQATENGQDADNNGQQLQQQQHQQGQQQPAISVSTRSMQASRPNTLTLPKAYISSFLYNRQGSSSLPNYTGFNKKAEPKENFFMHFGRK